MKKYKFAILELGNDSSDNVKEMNALGEEGFSIVATIGDNCLVLQKEIYPKHKEYEELLLEGTNRPLTLEEERAIINNGKKGQKYTFLEK